MRRTLKKTDWVVGGSEYQKGVPPGRNEGAKNRGAALKGHCDVLKERTDNNKGSVGECVSKTKRLKKEV